MVRIKHSNREGSNYRGSGSRRVYEGDKEGDGARPSGYGVVHNSDIVWPYNASDDLVVVLVRRKKEPPHFFYTYCKQRMRR
ncbi:hypothetical protein PVK06_001637 [Gossypium arboreum]|uniref:Uncharacterized protein n=1 Tax=Gossypium arboreum TaxID=29729 RepID=A0ABR0R1T5_GOSAR|nr:hypothetical protein PVK06_001637 [Gossypium arboreum]